MSQNYSVDNIWTFETGKQVDIGIGLGGNATEPTFFISATEFVPREGTPLITVEDSEGNRSTNQELVQEDKTYNYSFSGSTDVDKITLLAYLKGGTIASVEDGSTGAFTNTVTFKNNVILPQFTTFYRTAGLKYRRITNCQAENFDFSAGENAKIDFTFGFMARTEDGEPPTASTISSVGITDIQYQSGSFNDGGSIMRYTLTATDLSTVVNGNILRIPTTVTGISNTENIGDFIIVAVNDGADTVDVINPNIFDNTKDETTLTTNTVSSIIVTTTFVYPAPTDILMTRQSLVKDADNIAGLSAATFDGLISFESTMSNQNLMVRESNATNDPQAIVASALAQEISFSQTLSGIEAGKKFSFDEDACTLDSRAFLLEVKDDCKFLGTSTTLNPLLSIQVEGRAVGTVTGLGGTDKVTIDWTLNTKNQQSTVLIIQSEVDGSTF